MSAFLYVLEIVRGLKVCINKGVGCFIYSNLDFSLEPVTGRSRVYITKMVLRYRS